MVRIKESLYAAIDVGTTKVCTLVARVQPSTGTLEVVALGHAVSQGMKKGMVVSTEELQESVKLSVAEAQDMLGRPLPAASVGVTGHHFTSLNAGASAARNGEARKAISQQEVDRVVLSTMPAEMGQRQVVHIIPRAYQVNGEDGVRSAVGLSGDRIAVESHVVLGDLAPLENVARVVRLAGAKVKGLVAEHLASSEAVLTAEEREMGVVLADIGGGTTDMAIFKDGALWHTAVIPVGGYQFTTDISLGLEISFGAAEEAKLSHGTVLTERMDPERTVEVRTGTGPNDKTKKVQRLTLCTLLHDRAVELVRLIMHTARQAGLDRMPPAGLVITGGTANLAGLVELAQDYAGCPVRRGHPSPALGLPQEMEDSSFATSVGLLLWSINNRHPRPITNKVVFSVPVAQRLKNWFSRLRLGRQRMAA